MCSSDTVTTRLAIDAAGAAALNPQWRAAASWALARTHAAPGLWRAGKQEGLSSYCMRDVVALAELGWSETLWVRVPGGGGTDRM